jgi:GntR family transcriptional regulator
VRLRVNPAEATPIYSQIVAQVTYAVASGALAPGERLPAVRDLAVELTVNPNTILKAYRELEYAGVVESRRGLGCFVAGDASARGKDQARKALAQKCAAFAREGAKLGFTLQEMSEMLKQEYQSGARRTKAGGSPRAGSAGA